MATQEISWLLRLYMLLLLTRRLDPSSSPDWDMVPLDVLPENLEQQDSLEVLEDLCWRCSVLGVLIDGFFVGWHIGKRLKRHWREEKGHAALDIQGTCSQGHCCQKLIVLHQESQDLRKMCLLYSTHLSALLGKAKKEKGDLEEEETALVPSTMDPWLQHGSSP